MKENKISKWIIIVLLIVIAILLFFLYQEKQNPIQSPENPDNTQNPIPSNPDLTPDVTISEEEALQIVLNHANLKKEDIRKLDIEKKYKYDKNIYEIDFEYQYYEYEYYVDAKTKEILYSFKEFD